jgi:hypothetical protein
VKCCGKFFFVCCECARELESGPIQLLSPRRYELGQETQFIQIFTIPKQVIPLTFLDVQRASVLITLTRTLQGCRKQLSLRTLKNSPSHKSGLRCSIMAAPPPATIAATQSQPPVTPGLSDARLALTRKRERERNRIGQAQNLKTLTKALSELEGDELDGNRLGLCDCSQLALAVFQQQPLTITRSVVVPIDSVLDGPALVRIAKRTKEDQLRANQNLVSACVGLDDFKDLQGFELSEKGKSIITTLLRLGCRVTAMK